MGIDYRRDSHTMYKIECHCVGNEIPLPSASGRSCLASPQDCGQAFERFEILILWGVVSKDHVHILVSAPPNIMVSEIIRCVKG